MKNYAPYSKPRGCYDPLDHLSGVCSEVWSFGGDLVTCRSESTPCRTQVESLHVVMHFLGPSDWIDNTL